MYFKNLLILSSLFFATALYAQRAKITLEKGQKYQLTTQIKTTSIFTTMGQEMESNTDNTIVEGIEIKDTRPAETDLSKVISKLGMKMQMMGQETNYDSDKKNNTGPLAENLDKLVGKVKNITIDAGGNVLKENKDSDTASDIMLMGMTAQTGIGFIKTALIGHELRLNSAWPDTVDNNVDKLRSKIQGVYKVESIEGNIATVSFNGNQQMSGKVEQMGQEVEMSGTNKLSTRYKMDLSSGLILESSSITEGSSNIDAMGMVIPLTTKTTTTTALKKL